MAIRHSITLSTTEPNNEVGVIKIRQADEQTQTLEVQITENGVPKSYQGLAVYFCAKLGQTAGLGIIEQKLKPEEMTNPANGKLEYTMRAEDWQILGRQRGYFSFRKMKDEHEFVEQFTTRDFTFDVIKSVYSDGLKEVKKDGSTYVWTVEEMIRYLQEFIDSGRTDFDEWYNEIKDNLSEDAAGNLMLLYQDLRDKTGKDSDFREFESENSFMKRVYNEQSERGINVKWFGAVGDGVTDDTQAIQQAIDSIEHIYFPTGSFLISGNLIVTSDLKIETSSNVQLVSTENSNIALDVDVLNFELSNITLDGVGILTLGTRENNVLNFYANNATIKNTQVYGLHLSGLNRVVINNVDLVNIGTGDIITSWQGFGIRLQGANNVSINNVYCEGVRGATAIGLQTVKYFNLSDFEIFKCDYRGVNINNDGNKVKMYGFIKNGKISEMGTFASHNTGVGCNGIYGNRGNLDNVVIDNIIIENVCENAIEGVFGLVKNIYVDGTGVDIENHPTPSACGINLYGKRYENCIVKNTYLPAYYVYDNVNLDDTGIKNLTLIGLKSENSGGDNAIFLNGNDYNNLTIKDCFVDKPLYINFGKNNKNVNMANNYCPSGFYQRINNHLDFNIFEKSTVVLNGFKFKTTTELENFTQSNVSITRNSETITDLTRYFPKITNNETTYGRLVATLNNLPPCTLLLEVLYKGNTLGVSFFEKDSDGNQATAKSKTLDNATDWTTKKIVYQIKNGNAADIYLKIGNSAANAEGYIKDVRVKIIPN